MPIREANVDYDTNWPWPGEPWPWCPFAERKAEFWGDLAYPAVPHDTHVVNDGNTDCPGHPGLVDNVTGVEYIS